VVTVLWNESLHSKFPSELAISTNIVQHIAQSRLLKRINAQPIVLFNLDPSTHIFALVVLTRRQPLSRVAVALLAVAGSANSKKLRAGQAVTFISTCCGVRLDGGGNRDAYSLANCSRRASVQVRAPETQASFWDEC